MITELAQPFAMSLPAVSRHIRVLENAGLVRRAVDGRVHRCTLDVKPFEAVERWLGFYRGFCRDNLDALAHHAKGGEKSRK
jgi:DNA-binding transcriptional ArsR family regulator